VQLGYAVVIAALNLLLMVEIYKAVIAKAAVAFA